MSSSTASATNRRFWPPLITSVLKPTTVISARASRNDCFTLNSGLLCTWPKTSVHDPERTLWLTPSPPHRTVSIRYVVRLLYMRRAMSTVPPNSKLHSVMPAAFNSAQKRTMSRDFRRLTFFDIGPRRQVYRLYCFIKASNDSA